MRQFNSAVSRKMPVFVLAVFLATSVVAQAPPRRDPPDTSEPLRIGVFDAPPFAMKNAQGQWDGINVALWREVATSAGLTWEMREVAGLNQLILEIDRGNIDVGIAPVALTARNEQTVDFTHIYYTSGLGIGVLEWSGVARWEHLVATIFSIEVGQALLVVLILYLIVAALMWLVERKRNPDFGRGPVGGIADAVWWAGTTFTTVGYGDKVPRSPAGRAVAILWMLVSVVGVATFTAAITARLTAAHFGMVRSAGDLTSSKVAAVEGTAADTYLRDRAASVRTFPTIEAALRSVARRDSDAVVHDIASLRHATRSIGAISILPEMLEPENYAFVTRHGSRYREPINLALLRVLEQQFWIDEKARYGLH